MVAYVGIEPTVHKARVLQTPEYPLFISAMYPTKIIVMVFLKNVITTAFGMELNVRIELT